jgi:hypothetical protein
MGKTVFVTGASSAKASLNLRYSYEQDEAFVAGQVSTYGL